MTFEKPRSGRLAGASAWLGALLQALPDAVILEDEDGRWFAVNPAALTLLQIEDGGWKGKTGPEIARSMPALARTLAALSLSGTSGRGPLPPDDGGLERVAPVTGASGEERILMVSKLALLDVDGKRRGLVTVARDVTDQWTGEETRRLRAGRDEVTGLLTRKLFVERLSAAAATAHQTRARMALLLVDLDAFRRLGAAFGPSAVDTLLVTVARRLLLHPRNGSWRVLKGWVCAGLGVGQT
ncbi:MAG: diguanylate cyclase [Acidobacteria bacterium]|nr:diguanylate cyclase [Acidobacteriota bacterium]